MRNPLHPRQNGARLVEGAKPWPAGLPAPLRAAGFFDPALKHYPAGLRAADPALKDPARLAAWRRGAEDALRAALHAVARSGAAERLVLRGGMTLRGWFGAAARRPRDLDFVARPASMKADGDEARSLLTRVADAVHARPAPGCAIARDVGLDAIWTYDRVEGRRLTFQVELDGFPGAPYALQVDVVFGESLHDAPAPITLDTPHGEAVLLAASARESLCWKLLWLHADMHPQPKDAFDAVVLARAMDPATRAAVGELLRSMALTATEWSELATRSPASIVPTLRAHGAMAVEWPHFAKEHPELAQGGCEALYDALDDALRDL